MTTNFLRVFSEQRRLRFMSHVSPEWAARIETGRPITLAEWRETRLNSYEAYLAYPLMDNECLLHVTENCRKQLSHTAALRARYPLRPPLIYDDLLTQALLPELLTRFKSLIDPVLQPDPTPQLERPTDELLRTDPVPKQQT